MPNYIEIKETVSGWTDGRTNGFTDGHLRPALLGRLFRRVDLKMVAMMHGHPDELTSTSTVSLPHSKH